MTDENNLIHEQTLSSADATQQLEIAAVEDVQTLNSVEQVPFQFAGFWMRFWAYLVDLIVIGSLNRMFIHPIFKWIDSDSTYSFLSAEVIVTTIVFYMYFVLMTKFCSQTLGKMIFGLKVVALKEEQMTWGTLIFRELIGRFISKTIVIGYLLVGFLPNKQGLHDLFADTSVILVRR